MGERMVEETKDDERIMFIEFHLIDILCCIVNESLTTIIT